MNKTEIAGAVVVLGFIAHMVFGVIAVMDNSVVALLFQLLSGLAAIAGFLYWTIKVTG